MSAATTTRSRTPDRQCADAVDVARDAAVELAGEAAVGEHLGHDADGERVVTHYFATNEAAYRGWRWAVTVARASRAKAVTVDEAVLLPGADALTAPEWVPWSERLRPGDLGPGDLLPAEPDDPRLEPGWTGADEPLPNSAVVRVLDTAEAAVGDDQPAADAVAQAVAADDLATLLTGEAVDLDTPAAAPATPAPEVHAAPTDRAAIGAVARELGFGRARVLSRFGLGLAADRWEEGFGRETPMAQAAPASCQSCGFLVPVGGTLGQAFGVCANEISPADGHVVAYDYGCGAHSEAAVVPAPTPPPPPVLDDLDLAPLVLHDES